MSFQLPPEREYLTAAEAAAEKLPGFQYDERHIRRMIGDGVLQPSQPRPGTRGREFCWTALPREARAEYLKRYGVASADDRDADPVAKADKRELRADARKKIVDAAQDFIARRGTTIEAGLKSFCKAYAKRDIPLDPFVYGIEPQIQLDQVRRWDRVIRKQGAGALVDRRGRKSATTQFDADERLRHYIIKQITSNSQLSLAGRDGLQGLIATDLGRIIPKRSLQRFVKTWKARNQEVSKALANPDQHRSHCKPAFGRRDEDVTFINARWELDATRADAMCTLPDGSERRVAITSVVDVFTRRAMMLISDQPRAAATMALFRRAIIAWGMPKVIKTDNGNEFTARAVERFCNDMGIQIKWCRPFMPEEKPYVERMFGTLNRGLFPVLPTFVGHNIAQRKAIESRRSFAHRFGEDAELVLRTPLSPQGLQARVDAWLKDIYEFDIHEGLQNNPRYAGLTPTPRAVAQAFADQALYLSDERILDALLMDAPDAGGIRVVGKKGIRIANRCYIAAELGARISHRVHVRFDPHDIGRIVVYNDDRTAFICVAEDPDITGGNRQQIAVQAQQVQRKHLRVVRATIKGIQREFPVEGNADRLLTGAGGDSFVPDDETKKSMDYAGPRLIAQRRALDALDAHGKPETPIEPTAAERADYEDRIAELEPKPEPEGVEHCDGYDRPKFVGDGWDFRFFDWALGWIASGERLDARDTQDFDTLRNDELFQRIRKQRQQEKGGAEEVA